MGPALLQIKPPCLATSLQRGFVATSTLGRWKNCEASLKESGWRVLIFVFPQDISLEWTSVSSLENRGWKENCLRWFVWSESRAGFERLHCTRAASSCQWRVLEYGAEHSLSTTTDRDKVFCFIENGYDFVDESFICCTRLGINWHQSRIFFVVGEWLFEWELEKIRISSKRRSFRDDKHVW